jgi:3-hydroxybutyryl-CoA dehydrogenase
MGRGIAAALALAGHRVTLAEPDAITRRRSLAIIISGLGADGAVSQPEIASAVDRLRVVERVEEAVIGAGRVIEAAPEQLGLKSELWQRLGVAAGRDAILASNTSALDIDALAGEVPAPERVVGTHWFNPAHVIPCVEIVRGAATSDTTIATVTDILRSAGKQPVVVRNSPGFVANRIQFALVREALLCLEEGLASPQEIDAIVSSSFGPRLAVLGPLANADLGGLDTYRWIFEFLRSTLGERFAPPALLSELVDQGRFGTKSKAGIVDYPQDAGDELARRRDTVLRCVLAATEEKGIAG